MNDRQSGLGLSPQIPANRKVLLIEVCRNEYIESNASMTYTGREIEVPEIRNLGPLIEKIRAHVEVTEASAEFLAQVSTQFSCTGRSWSAWSALVTGAAEGPMAGAYLTDEQKIGLLTRIKVECASSTGNSAESGRVSVWLEITLKT